MKKPGFYVKAGFFMCGLGLIFIFLFHTRHPRAKKRLRVGFHPFLFSYCETSRSTRHPRAKKRLRVGFHPFLFSYCVGSTRHPRDKKRLRGLPAVLTVYDYSNNHCINTNRSAIKNRYERLKTHAGLKKTILHSLNHNVGYLNFRRRVVI